MSLTRPGRALPGLATGRDVWPLTRYYAEVFHQTILARACLSKCLPRTLPPRGHTLFPLNVARGLIGLTGPPWT